MYNKTIIKRTADGYLLAGKTLLDSGHKNGAAFFAYFISPCAVNLSFACELYLKFLFMEEKNENYDNGHKLKPLYQKLSGDLKSIISNEYCKTETIETLDQCLTTHDNAFVSMRYFFEETQAAFEPNSLFNFARSLKKVCENFEKEANANAD